MYYYSRKFSVDHYIVWSRQCKSLNVEALLGMDFYQRNEEESRRIVETLCRRTVIHFFFLTKTYLLFGICQLIFIDIYTKLVQGTVHIFGY